MSPQAERTMRKFAAFVRLSRLTFLLGGFAGFGLGAAVALSAGASLSPALYAAGQTMVTAFHLMTHYANEFFDRESDRHTEPTPFSGGSGVLVAGALEPRTALTAALVCASVGSLAVLGFAVTGMPVAAAAGAAIGVCAWSYSAPPLRLAGRGWGELDTALVVAVLVPLAGYALGAGSVDGRLLRATLAPACAMFAMMLAVEWPDRAADAAAGKRNLVVRCGAPAAIRLARCAALLTIPAMLFAAAGAWGVAAAFALLLIPPVAGFVRRFDVATPAAEIAARGVTVFFLTVVFEALAFLTELL